ncbi:MAG: hypothetical protein HY399_06880 [Elusimicrobia bacterium]|nr:hypothetical protein [Elusimicrobiota bacterium]
MKFNKDHVIPEAFGTYGSQTMTLTREVCWDCNAYFGDNIELVVARGGLEAIERIHHGLKPMSELNQINRDRISAELGDGPMVGTKIEPVTHGNIPQVGLKLKNKEKRDHFTLNQLEGMERLDLERYDTKATNGILLGADTRETQNHLISELGRLGIRFRETGRAPGANGRLPVDYSFVIDSLTMRMMAKIAFSYSAKMRGGAYLLKKDFDEIRRFIRYDERPIPRPVKPTTKQLLRNELRGWRITDGHLVVSDAVHPGRELVAHVSLFNQLPYRIVLCSSYSGKIIYRSFGHHFDFKNKTISELYPLA